MFKNKLDKLIVYKPTDEDKINFRERFTTGAKAKEIIRSTSRQISEIMYLFGWACSCFLIIFMITFRLEQCKANKAFKQDK
jgi:hypothetical protein